MRKARWLANGQGTGSSSKPVIYHCISRVVDRRFVFGERECGAFANARERFGPKRKDGARTMRGKGSGAKGLLWSARDLRVGI